MKSVVLGKVMEKTYFVEPNKETITIDGEEKIVYKAKPVIKEESKIKEWLEICHFDGEPRYNNVNSYTYLKLSMIEYDGANKRLNISEDEEVGIYKEIFRADLNELHLQSSKILEEIEVNKTKAKAELKEYIGDFNEMMIRSNKAMKDYCDLHHLDYWNSDCETVFSLVHPDKEYVIKNGKMECKPVHVTLTSNNSYLNSGYVLGSDGYCVTIANALDTKVSAIDCAIRG